MYESRIAELENKSTVDNEALSSLGAKHDSKRSKNNRHDQSGFFKDNGVVFATRLLESYGLAAVAPQRLVFSFIVLMFTQYTNGPWSFRIWVGKHVQFSFTSG